MQKRRVWLQGLFASAVLAGCAPALAAPAQVGTSVTIYRDKMGVPHVYADTAPALFYGASYAIAHDRLAEAEVQTRKQLGRAAEILGPDQLEADKLARLSVQTDAEMKAQFDRLQPDEQAILRGMHAGWIAYVREVKANPALLPYEFKQWGIAPTEWSLWEFLNSMGGVSRGYGSGGGGRELTNLAFLRDLTAKFGEAQAKIIFNDVAPLQDPDAVPIIPPGQGARLSAEAGTLFDRQARLPVGQLGLAANPPEQRGASRVLMIGAKKSASGHPIMLQATADGPDLHISGAGFDAAGYVYPSMSPVIQGRTPTNGWTITTGEADIVDVYAEKLNPANKRQYFYKGAWRDMEVRREEIVVKGAAPVVFEIERTVHGPIIQREDDANVAYSRKNAFSGHELTSIAMLLKLNRVKSFEDYKRAVASPSPRNSNINYAGLDGHIALTHAGQQPIRPAGVDPRLPVPGTGEYEWLGLTGPKDMPFVVDPAQGYIHAWNNKPLATTTYGDSSRYGKSFRTWMGRSLAESKDKITLEDVHEFHREIGRSAGAADLTVTTPHFFTPYLRTAVKGDARLEAAVAAMDSWNAQYEDKDGDGFYDNPGLTIFRKWIETAQAEVIGDDIGEWWHKIDDRTFVKYRTDVLLRAIEGPDAGAPMKHDWFNGRPRDAVLRETLEHTLAALEKTYGSPNLSAWKQRAYYRYYDETAVGKDPTKPIHPYYTRVYRTAGQLGLQPATVPGNMSESWNMLIELKPGEQVLYDTTPSGGQNQFISTDGKGNPNIADQVRLHQNFEFKAVALDRKRVEREAVSKQQLRVPPLPGVGP